METGEKLDQIQGTMTEVRVSMATLSGDVRAVMGRMEGHDRTAQAVEVRLRALENTSGTLPTDAESRIRTLERRIYGIPGLAALLGVAGLAVAIWSAFGK